MASEAYGIAASLMRYLFALILLFILAQTAVRSIIEGRRLRASRRLAELDVRYIELIEPDERCGEWIALDEGARIGSAEKCDIQIEESELLPVQASVSISRGRVVLHTGRRRFCEINGERLPRNVELRDGDVVQLRDVRFVCHRRSRRTGAGDE